MILKYPVEIGVPFNHRMPASTKLLDVQLQGDQGPMLWALVDGMVEDVEPRSFLVVGTGPEHHPIDDRYEYVGTFQMLGGRLVWHLFEVKALD